MCEIMATPNRLQPWIASNLTQTCEGRDINVPVSNAHNLFLQVFSEFTILRTCAILTTQLLINLFFNIQSANMWTAHSSVGIAQTVFYVPVLAAVIGLLLRHRHEKPLIQWIVLLIFSIGTSQRPNWFEALPKKYLVRIVGGIMLIEYVSHSSSVGWVIVAIIFEGAGVIPLLVSLILHLVLVWVASNLERGSAELYFSKKLDFPTNRKINRGIFVTRALFFVGIITLIVGSALIGNYKDSNSTSIGLKLAKTGYVVISFIVFLAFCWALLFWFKMEPLSRNSRKVNCLSI